MAGVAAAAMRSRISSIFDKSAKVAAGAGAAAPAAVAAAAAAAVVTPDSFVTVSSTMNNIHVCVTNLEGQVVTKSSGGVVGFKHRDRASTESARAIGESVAKKAFERGYRLSHVRMKGPSRGRSQILRGLLVGGLRVADIRDVTPMPTNGCRPPHARRLFSTDATAAAAPMR